MATIPNISQSNGRHLQSADLPASPKGKLGSARGVTDSDRQQRAIQLKVSGWTYAAIGRELGVTRQRVQQMIRPSQQTIDALLRRSNGCCEKCEEMVSGHDAHVHHMRQQDDYNALDNLLYLCKACHRSEHGTESFRDLPVNERRAAAEKWIEPFLAHVNVLYCMSCGASGAVQGMCEDCKRRYKAVQLAKDCLRSWHRGTFHSLSQAIYTIRKHKLTPEDFGPEQVTACR